MGGFNDMIARWLVSILQGFDSSVQKCIDILTLNAFDTSSEMYQFIVQVTELIKPIALVIVTVCFAIEFLKITISMDILKYEYFFKCVMKFILAKVCIDASFMLMKAIYSTATEWITAIGDTETSMGTTIVTLVESGVSELGFFETLGFVVTTSIIALAISLIGIIIRVLAYARMFELYVLMAVSPLPSAMLPLEDSGTSRIPYKFVMNFASVCLKGVFMVMTFKMYGILVSSTIMNDLVKETDVSNMMYTILLASLVLLVSVIQSSGWAKATLDA